MADSATQIATPLDTDVEYLVFYANETNTGTVYLGASNVSDTGAEQGWPLSAGQVATARVVGPGADEFYFIRATVDGAQTVTVQQWG